MKGNAEKRAFERHGYAADIAFSYFNKTSAYNAEILNLGQGGMCFKSDSFLQPGATICIRLKKNKPNGPCSGYCEGLHSVALAEIKWCNELLGSEASHYGVGVKYYGPVY
jgi:hypothetical protein